MAITAVETSVDTEAHGCLHKIVALDSSSYGHTPFALCTLPLSWWQPPCSFLVDLMMRLLRSSSVSEAFEPVQGEIAPKRLDETSSKDGRASVTQVAS